MPKNTFFNLPDEKRERIIEAAIDEFASHSYHQARITAIINNSNIANGSFYQYFEDKKDLLKHIIDITVDKKLEYLNRDMLNNREKYSFFELLREIYLSGIKFAKEHPRLVSINNKLLNNKNLQIKIWGEYKDKTSEFFKDLLETGLKKGEVEPSINIKIVSKLLTGLNYSLSDIIYENGKGIDLNNLDNEIKIIDEMLNFIENGIKKRNN